MTYQFDTVVKKDNTIQVPSRYQVSAGMRIKVTVIDAGESTDASRSIKGVHFSDPMLKTKGWKFDREEANACS